MFQILNRFDNLNFEYWDLFRISNFVLVVYHYYIIFSQSTEL